MANGVGVGIGVGMGVGVEVGKGVGEAVGRTVDGMMALVNTGTVVISFVHADATNSTPMHSKSDRTYKAAFAPALGLRMVFLIIRPDKRFKLQDLGGLEP